VSDGFGNDFYSRGAASKFLARVESKTSQFEIAVESLARFISLTPVPPVTARDEPWPFFHF